jgi:beta-glucanase (GH16 family)
LNPSKWTVWTGGAFNNELQYYQAANVQLYNGDLQITAREEQVIGGLIYPGAQPPNNTRDFAYTSGRVESVEHWRGSDYSKVRIYARIKLNTHDYGLWPAVWTYGDPWPLKGEIDIFEAKVDNLNGQPPAWYQTNYFYGTAAGVNLVEQPAAASLPFFADLSDDYYHVVMVEWTENELKFEFDGMPVDTKTYVGPNDPFEYIPEFWHKRQRIVLNLAYGGIFFGSTPITPGSITNATMKVDWVEVFVQP